MARKTLVHLNTGRPAISFGERGSDTFMDLTREVRLISLKPVIYAANVDEEGLAEDNEYWLRLFISLQRSRIQSQ